MTGTRLLLVDDHVAYRTRARALLEAAGFVVVGEAGTGAEALEAVRTLHPEVVLLDVVLPDIDGFTVCDRLSRQGSGAAVVLTSSRRASAYRDRLCDSPASGFIAKVDLTGAMLAELLGEADARR
jgi:DNA-binding NarL/FixJ family response regulator